MLRFKASTCIFTAQGATLQNEPQVCICDRRPRLTAKRFQNGRPACSPESPDFMRRQRTAVGETFRAVPACVLHWWSQRTWYQSTAWLEVKAPGGAGPGSEETRSHDLPVLAVQLPVRVLHLLGQEILQNHAKGRSGKSWSRKWKNLPVCLHSVSSFTYQWSRSTWVPSCCLESPLLGGARSSTCLQPAVAKDQSTAACWQDIRFCCVLASKST
nr:uncharacterized protein LOC125990304 isoform X17 [Syngnathus scovelli]